MTADTADASPEAGDNRLAAMREALIAKLARKERRELETARKALDQWVETRMAELLEWCEGDNPLDSMVELVRVGGSPPNRNETGKIVALGFALGIDLSDVPVTETIDGNMYAVALTGSELLRRMWKRRH